MFSSNVVLTELILENLDLPPSTARVRSVAKISGRICSPGGKFSLRKRYDSDSTENDSQLCMVLGSQLDFPNWETINLLRTIKNRNFEWTCGSHDDFAAGPTTDRPYLARNDPR